MSSSDSYRTVILEPSHQPVILHLSNEEVERIFPSIHVWTGQYVDWVVPDGRPLRWDSPFKREMSRKRSAMEYRLDKYPYMRFPDKSVPFVLAVLATRYANQLEKRPSVRRTPCRNELLERQKLSGVVAEQTWHMDRQGRADYRLGRKKKRRESERGERTPT